MRLRHLLALAVGAALVTALAVLLLPRLLPEASEEARAELERLERWRAHAEPGSARERELAEEIERAREGEAGRPEADNPEEFARILAEMKIPADRTTSEYAPGYQKAELEKAQSRRSVLGVAAALPWVSRGPGNVGGRARGIVIDPDDPTDMTWYIGSVGGGVWKTTDGASTWQWLTPDFPVLSTSALAMAASNHDVIYVGTGESFYNIDTVNGDGILKSTDRGATWSHLASTVNDPAFNNVARIVVDPVDADVVLAATTRGRYKEYLNPRSSIFRSADGGASWSEVFATTTIGAGGRVKRVLQIVPSPTNFDTLYATVRESGILRSIDRGITWSWINAGITDTTGRFELAVHPLYPRRLYASAEGASHSELWISQDGGDSWQETFEAGTEPNWLGAQGWYDNTIVCHPTDPNTVFVGGIYLYKIVLSGTTRTTSYLTAPVHVDHHGLEIIDAPGGGWRILNTSDGGVAVSTSQDTGWSQKSDGLVTTQFYGIDKRPGASAYVGGTQDNGTWLSPENPGALTPWNWVIGGDGYEASWNFDDPMKVIGGSQFNGLERSLDGGQTWSAAITAVSPPGTIDVGGANAPFITKIAKCQAAPDLLFAVGKQGVWRSTDFGGTWSLSAIPAGNWGPLSSFHDVRISRADPDVVWAGSRMDGSGQIQRSVDGGVTFNPTTNYTTITMGGISGLATHPTDPDVAYALFSFAERPKILVTNDGGATWNDITGFESSAVSTNGFPDVAVYDLLVFSNDTNRVWAATEIGIVESLDGGLTWALADNGLPNVAVWFLTEVEDEIVAGTHGRGVWSVSIPDLIAGRTFNPLIDQLVQGPDGYLTADLNLRSDYDSTELWVDGGLFATLPANTARTDTVIQIPVLTSGTKTVQVKSYRFGTLYPSVVKTYDAFAPQPAVFAYENDFDTPSDDFFGSGFQVDTQPGFTGAAINSAHPYVDGSTSIYVLTKPIRVAWSNATVEFDEIALVEAGDPGSVYGDFSFWDYVVVEGSLDGVTWTPLAPGWDCRAYPEWEAAWTNSTTPGPSLLRHRTLNLRDVFNWNDTVLLRFRLFADTYVNGWGWMIDNLRIQVGSQTGVGDGARPILALEQSAPNPMRAAGTTIRFSLPDAGPVSLDVFDVQGRLVRSLLDGNRPAGLHQVSWDGRDASGLPAASGIYFYRLVTPDRTLQKKLVVVR